MFDTMTLTKIVGGFCGMLLVFLLGNWAAEGLYHVGASGHGDGEHAQAYTIAVEGTKEAEPEEPVDLDALMASADAAKGAKVFAKCKACHKIDGSNSTGPHLDGVFDRDIASVPDFGYSDALKNLDGQWNVEHLFGFLQSPKSYAPGTKMTFAGLPKESDRANLIAYLETLK
ncbi:c-type cytochrome [Frigidibacter sp. ROC022]|uniref:c-type cytochrome n=1 Tax=Frigidibacter sp. ROC022 TaxID=2971796 RepID=UPI00215A7888|nr:cytochrome c family protein [Frigidibacter sp. ROC022]MCR8725961.1 cytochrome c family protein [Frigidibacter sp. ROC022]